MLHYRDWKVNSNWENFIFCLSSLLDLYLLLGELFFPRPSACWSAIGYFCWWITQGAFLFALTYFFIASHCRPSKCNWCIWLFCHCTILSVIFGWAVSSTKAFSPCQGDGWGWFCCSLTAANWWSRHLSTRCGAWRFWISKDRPLLLWLCAFAEFDMVFPYDAVLLHLPGSVYR